MFDSLILDIGNDVQSRRSERRDGQLIFQRAGGDCPVIKSVPSSRAISEEISSPHVPNPSEPIPMAIAAEATASPTLALARGGGGGGRVVCECAGTVCEG